jgi:hypothetical protein
MSECVCVCVCVYVCVCVCVCVCVFSALYTNIIRVGHLLLCKSEPTWPSVSDALAAGISARKYSLVRDCIPNELVIAIASSF